MKNIILYIALFISVLTYMFWGLLPKGYFYLGNGLFILMLCTYIFYNDKKSFVKFCLFELSLSNLLQEICNTNTEFKFSELILIIVIPALWYYRNVLSND